MTAIISVVACAMGFSAKPHPPVVSQLVMIVGAPILFLTVLFIEAGMFLLKDGNEFGFPIWARTYPDAVDFVATYIALGASYLIARKATRMPLKSVRIVGWIETIGFVLLGVFELLLLGRRVCVG